MTAPAIDSISAEVPSVSVLARVADVLWLALAGALLTALAHLLYTEFLIRVLHTFTWTNREFAWLAMAGYLLCFLLLAIPVAAIAVLFRRVVGLRVVTTIFATLGFFSLFLLTQKIHPLAQFALALGLATQVARVVSRDARIGMRRVRIAAGVSFVSLGALGLIAFAAPRLREQWVLSRLPAADSAAPNIILLIMDTVRAANLSVYGYERPTTPVLEQLGREGTVFEHAFAAAPWTAPSHASMMTGLWASESKADYLHPMDDTATTVAEVLTRRGYATGGFMANAGYAGHQVGLARGFAHYEDLQLSLKQAVWSTTLAQTDFGRRVIEGVENRQLWKVRNALRSPRLRLVAVAKGEPQSAADISRNFFAWRDGVGTAPYFAMLNFMDAHAPYDPPKRFATMFDSGKREVDRYDGGIAYEDSIIGSMVRKLKERGELDQTVLIITADHGEQFGEHGLGSHGNSLYLPVLHVPLIVRAPGRAPAATRVTSIVSLRDLAATLVDVGGAAGGSVPGVSLAAAWRSGSNAGLSPVLAEVSPAINPAPKNPTARGPIKTIIDSSWHYMRFGDGVEELYAWRSDSAETNNLAASPVGVEESRRRRDVIARTLGIRWPGTRVGRY